MSMSSAQREKHILELYPVVQIIARQLARRLPSSVDLDELVSVGMLGLIDAVDRFEPSRGVPLKAYAEIRVKGAMLDLLRSNDWVPRTVRRKNQHIEEVRQHLTGTLGRPPSRLELAGELGLSLDDFDRLSCKADLRRVLSLDAPVIEGGASLVEQVQDSEDTAEVQLNDAELQQAIDVAIGELSEKERVALSMSYLEGHTLQEIGGMLGISESRVCQIRSRAVGRIRKRIAGQAHL